MDGWLMLTSSVTYCSKPKDKKELDEVKEKLKAACLDRINALRPAARAFSRRTEASAARRQIAAALRFQNEEDFMKGTNYRHKLEECGEEQS
jgi:hypothetical protein